MTQPRIQKAEVLAGLTSQLEDYLETIFILQNEDRVARAKDIASRLGVTRGTVTSALKSLGEKGLINYQPYSHITLTDLGEQAAERVVHRHQTLVQYFRSVLQLPVEMAEENACRAEHILDAEVIERMNRFMEFLDRCPRTDPSWRQSFTEYCTVDREMDDCRDCLGRCLAGLYNRAAD